MPLDADDLRALLIQQLSPSSGDQDLATQAVTLYEAAHDTSFEAIEITFNDEDEGAADYEKALSKGNDAQEKAFETIKAPLKDARTSVIDHLEERMRVTARLAVEAGLAEEWPSYDWMNLQIEARRTSSSYYFRSAPPPQDLDAYWKVILDEFRPEDGLDLPLKKSEGGDWGRVWKKIVTRAQQGRYSPDLDQGTQSYAWLVAWAELGERPELLDDDHALTSLLDDEHSKTRDLRPRDVVRHYALEQARLMGMVDHPDSPLGAWARTRTPQPIAPGNFPWGHHLNVIHQASPAYKEERMAHLHRWVQIQVDAFPQLWSAWVNAPSPAGMLASSAGKADERLAAWQQEYHQPPSMQAVMEVAQALGIIYDQPEQIRAMFRQQDLQNRPAPAVSSRPRFRS